jgi:hypothetical protein
MASVKSLWPVPVSLLIILGAALVVFPLYMHQEVSQNTGAFAPLYLYEYSPYDTIVLEVHYQAGAAPSDAALENLAGTLVKYTGKHVELKKYQDLPNDAVAGRIDDDNVSAIGGGIIQNYGQARMGWISGSLPIYILYVNAEGPAALSGENDTVVAVSYRADSFIMLKDHIDQESLEKAVLVHETGHLLGLDHDDDPKCVMTAVLFESRSKTDPPVNFCPAHEKELERRRYDLFYNARRASGWDKYYIISYYKLINLLLYLR